MSQDQQMMALGDVEFALRDTVMMKWKMDGWMDITCLN